MRSTLLFFLSFFLVSLTNITAQQVLFQGFEGTAADNFTFSATPAKYNNIAAEDVWSDTTTTFQIPAATGNRQWYMRDLNNPSGGGDFAHTLDFGPIDISAFSSNTLTFKTYTEAYDTDDSIGYYVAYDNGTNWSTYTPLNKNSQAWETTTLNAPAGAQFIRLRLAARQNGGTDYAAWDDIQLFSAQGDVVAPLVVNAVFTSANSILLKFSEPMDATAENLANYTGIANLVSALRTASGDTVILQFSAPFVNGQANTLTVSDVQDAAGNALTTPFLYSFVFNNSVPNLVITEINYNPPSNDPDILEFIEIYNNGTQDAEIGGLLVSGVVSMVLPGITLAPTEMVLIAQNKIACDTFFVGQTFYQWSSGVLTNGGNTININNSEGVLIDQVIYDDAFPWPLEPDGFGPSLELLAPNFNNNDGANWKSAATQVDSSSIFANPGVVNVPSLAIIGFSKTSTRAIEGTDTVQIAVTVSNLELPLAEARVQVLDASTAIEGEDYVLLDTIVTFPLGAITPILVNVVLKDDATPRDSRYLLLKLSDFTAAEGGPITEHALLIQDNDTPAPAPQPGNLVQLEYLSSFSVDTLAATAEISSYDPISKRLFVTNILQNSLEIIDLKNPYALKGIQKIDLSPYAAGINHVAVFNGLVAVAVEDDTLQNPGQVLFFDANGTFLNAVTVGALPDMITFTPDGTKVLTANEGEPSQDYTKDPEGTVSVVDLSVGVAALTNANVTTISFAAFNADSAALKAAGVRLYGVGASVAQDLEPEYIAIAPDGKTAYVTLQENNAIGIINLETNTVTAISPLGTKVWQGSSLDVADNLSGGPFFNNWNVRGLYQPDGIAFFGGNYLITANEGDAREYTALSEIVRLGSTGYVLDSTTFPTAKYLKRSDLLGRLNVTTGSGDTDGDGDFDEIHTLGGRSVSIWDATTGTQVWDSGDDFERITAADPTYGALFNASNSNNTFKNRSDDKGPEPEGVTVAEIEGRQYAFVVLERIGGVMLYDVSNPTAPEFIQYINTRQLGADAGADLGPEGILFIPKAQSPNGRNLLIVSNEISGSVSVFQINIDKTATDFDLTKYAFENTPLIGTVDSLNIYEGGVSGLHYREGKFQFISDRGPNADASLNSNANGALALHFPFPEYTPKVWEVTTQAGGTLLVNKTSSLLRPDGSGLSGLPLPVGQGNTGEVAWSDTSGTVVPNDAWGIDSEGITQDNEGNWWVCDEYGTSIYQLDENFKVKRRYTPFPAQAEDFQLDTLLGKRRPNRGLEGIAYTPNGKIFAIIQSPASNPNLTVGNASQIHRLIELDPATGSTRTFAYVHNAVLGDIRSRDWKMGDLTAINNEEFLVLEHAERNGWNAKNIFKISIAGATPVTGNDFGGLTLEQLNNTAGLVSNGITPVSKSLYADLLELGWERQHDKPEGLTILNDSTFAVINDNDFGISSPLLDGTIVATNKTTKLYVYTVPADKHVNYVSPYCQADLGQDYVSCGDLETEFALGSQGFTQAAWTDGSTDLYRFITTPGTYAVTAVNQYGCTARDTVTLGQSDFPSVDLGENQALCPGNTITLDAGVFETYTWNNGDSTQNVLVSTPGGYSVSVTNEFGCEGVGFVFISSASIPTVELGPNKNLCAGQTLTLDAANVGASFLWSNGDTTQTISTNIAGIYTVTVTNTDGCVNSDLVTLVNAVSPNVNLGADKSACEGQSLSLVSGFAGANILWSTGATTPILSVSTTGTYSVQVTLLNGCADTDSVQVSFNPVPTFDLGPDSTICANETIVLFAGVPAANNTYLWSTGASTQSVTTSTENVYAVTVTNSFGCSSSDDVLVEVEICSDTEEPTWVAGALVFPNPTTGFVTLRMTELPTGATRLSVFNSIGQVLENRENISDLDTFIDLSVLPKGLYLLQLQSGSTLKTWRVAVQ